MRLEPLDGRAELGTRGRDVREQGGENAVHGLQTSSRRVRELALRDEELPDALPPFEVSPGQPVEQHRPHDVRGVVEAPDSPKLDQCPTHVLPIEIEDFLPPPLLASTETRVGSMGEVGVVVRVGDADRVSVWSTLETFGRVLGDGLDHAKPSLGLRCRVHEQALVDEGGERRQHGQRVAAHDRPCGFDRERIAEHAETLEDIALVVCEELVAPVDRRAHRLLARRGVTTTARGRVE